jgi:NAD(P)-dependent dehydrogenase (short-subunit alcohol dehydrogenase family)
LNHYKEWALITGAPNGFFPEIAKVLLEANYNLVALGKDARGLGKIINFLQAEYPGKEILPVVLNALEPESSEELFSWLQAKYITPRIIIHHLGGTINQKSSLSSRADWINVLQLNVLFSIAFNSLIVESLLKFDFARIINIGSVSAVALRGSGPYACAKALLHAYTKTLGRELARTNIGVSCLSLGAFVTENSNWAKYMTDRPGLIEDFLRHHQAVGRLGSPDEIGVVMRMLIAKEFSFGQGIIVEYDGGTM